MIAMILAAGRGERMRPLTDHVPKPLLEVGGKPLIVYLIEALAAAGCRELVINTAHLSEALVHALGDGSGWGLRIRWSHEPAALETAGGIAQAGALLGTAPFLVVNGDLWTDVDLAAFCTRATTALADASIDAHLMLVDNPPHHPAGDFCLHEGRIVEEGVAQPSPVRLTFAGIAVYRPRLFANIVPGTRAALAPLLFEARARGALSGEHFRGCWIDIGTRERLATLDRQLRGSR